MDAVDGQQCLMCLTDALIAFHVALLCPPFFPLTKLVVRPRSPPGPDFTCGVDMPKVAEG